MALSDVPLSKVVLVLTLFCLLAVVLMDTAASPPLSGEDAKDMHDKLNRTSFTYSDGPLCIYSYGPICIQSNYAASIFVADMTVNTDVTLAVDGRYRISSGHDIAWDNVVFHGIFSTSVDSIFEAKVGV